MVRGGKAGRGNSGRAVSWREGGGGIRRGVGR